MAFQTTAFQNNAFQICSNSYREPVRKWCPEKEEVKEALKEYEKAIDVLAQVETEVEEEKLIQITDQFRAGDRLDLEEMGVLLRRVDAKQEFDEAIRLIKKLEEEMLEILVLLLLANES